MARHVAAGPPRRAAALHAHGHRLSIPLQPLNVEASVRRGAAQLRTTAQDVRAAIEARSAARLKRLAYGLRKLDWAGLGPLGTTLGEVGLVTCCDDAEALNRCIHGAMRCACRARRARACSPILFAGAPARPCCPLN